MPRLSVSHLPLVLLASMLSAQAYSANALKPDTPAEYAYSMPLKVSGEQGVVAFRLPQAVYVNARTANLDDLRVFDANGVVQPHALHRPQPEPASRRDSIAARIFPVRSGANPAASATSIDVDIRTRPDGSVMSAQVHAGKAPGSSGAADTVVGSLILDFGAAAKGDENNPVRIDALRFDAPRGRPNYNAEVWLQTSSDLKRWSTIGAAELNWLSNENGQTLASDRLEFAPQTFRYARLIWRRGVPAEFAAIHAEAQMRQSSEPVRETLWVAPDAARKPGAQGDQHAGELIYPAAIALPVEQVSLRLSEPNIVLPVALGYYVERPTRHSGRATEWVFQPISHATFYQITQDGQTRRSGALNVAPIHLPEWVLRPLNPATTARPELGLSWQPATLVFLAGGTPPYTLTFGRADALPTGQPLGQVAPGFTPRELARLEQAQAGELRAGRAAAAGDSAALQAGLSARHRTFVLWGVLLLGLVVLGAMAWKLIRQMNSGSDTSR